MPRGMVLNEHAARIAIMPYADKQSPAAVASQRRASRKYYYQNRKSEIARSRAYNVAHTEHISKTNAYRRAFKTPKEKVLWLNAKNRAKAKGIPFSITIEDVVVPERCPALGIALSIHNKHAMDNSPSIDRINPDKGYVPSNIQVISHRANTIKSNASLEDLERITEWMRKSANQED